MGWQVLARVHLYLPQFIKVTRMDAEWGPLGHYHVVWSWNTGNKGFDWKEVWGLSRNEAILNMFSKEEEISSWGCMYLVPGMMLPIFNWYHSSLSFNNPVSIVFKWLLFGWTPQALFCWNFTYWTTYDYDVNLKLPTSIKWSVFQQQTEASRNELYGKHNVTTEFHPILPCMHRTRHKNLTSCWGFKRLYHTN